jgi:hypothetical protein
VLRNDLVVARAFDNQLEHSPWWRLCIAFRRTEVASRNLRGVKRPGGRLCGTRQIAYSLKPDVALVVM